MCRCHTEFVEVAGGQHTCFDKLNMTTHGSAKHFERYEFKLIEI